MAFLDNSGDIILDAVLTDTGRARLAKGDGTFRIVKFALGDDEIDYTTYKNSNHAGGAHASGSAYYDLDILQTPILEAFTNNTSVMKSKLLSVPRTNLLYLPVLKLQEVSEGSAEHGSGQWNSTAKTFYITADTDTRKKFMDLNKLDSSKGVIDGTNGTIGEIVIHQGLDTHEISHVFQIDGDLLETQYIVEMDNRLGNIVSAQGTTSATLSFLDDDNIASYFFSLGTDVAFVRPPLSLSDDANVGSTTGYPIAGPQGTRLVLSVKSSIELRSSIYLFQKLGGEVSDDALTGLGLANQGNVFRYIDTNIRITGATTGYRIDIPVRFLKLKD